jgi:hypothetical protein
MVIADQLQPGYVGICRAMTGLMFHGVLSNGHIWP